MSTAGEEWAVLVGASYEFGILGHYVSLREALRELSDRGWSPAVQVYGSSGRELEPGAGTERDEWFHLIARKPLAAGAGSPGR